ncbi:hypothetical protein F2Q70_00019238 [Brassica cretica]|uniref:Uncharacterized protein n=2 Tax=Brassica cretica TaxID=69181 RepID=A0A8S9GTD3_BRACR|nr:hypothetical protein F2Q70_00019238 [Brassica cretica]KAF2559118.1 hypothetical protein F2Q68_00012772 [Brassica cretica]KAF3607997.1 hypothetical protein DY000_02044271 [Brassica cretica]
MSFSRLLVTLSLMMMMAISNEPFALAHKEEYLMNTTTKRLFETRPNVHMWVAKIMARPAWRKACDANAWYNEMEN